MKLKLTPIYILSFLCLTFFIMELHEWLHALIAALVSGSWGPRGFDRWDIGGALSVSNGQRALATLAGPLVNFVVIWIGWIKMGNRDSLADQSLGCNLVLAAQPMGLLIAAFSGGGDTTIGLKLLFSHYDGIYHHLFAILGLLIILVVCIPALIKVFVLLPSWGAKFFYFPIFLLAPMWIHHFVSKQLDELLKRYEPDEGMAYAVVFFWTIALFGGWLYTRRRLETLLVDSELPL
jgi:hypothetical protein